MNWKLQNVMSFWTAYCRLHSDLNCATYILPYNTLRQQDLANLRTALLSGLFLNSPDFFYCKYMFMQITLVAIWLDLLVSNVVPWAVMLQVLLLRPLVTMTENSYSVFGFSPWTMWFKVVVLAIYKLTHTHAHSEFSFSKNKGKHSVN